MYDLAPDNAPWFEHLVDSVRALGHAARDWQLAAQDATVAHGRADHPGLDFHEGQVIGLPWPDATGWDARPQPRRPHGTAQRALEKHYRDVMYQAQHGYEDAARLYASGAAWAVRAVQDGLQPQLVEFHGEPRTEGPDVLVPGSERIGIDALRTARYSDAEKVAAAFKRLDDCLYSGQVAEDLGHQDYIADHEAAEMFEAWTVAEGTADAAYAYGLVLEGALQFVLLGPKDAHRKALAAARAAAAPQPEGEAR
jgi:hypothetical protein